MHQDAIDPGQVYQKLYKEYYSRFRQFAQAGYGKPLMIPDTLDEARLFESFKRNLSHFSALKAHTAQEELRTLKKLPWKDFRREGAAVMSRFNDVYLQAELPSILSGANAAERWQEIQKRKFLYPNLRYETAGDERVRASHAALDGRVYPVDHSFWDSFYPPNGWRCRCIVIQTDEPVKEGEADFTPDAGFRNNTAKTRLLVEEDHPYYDVPSSWKNKILPKAEQYRADFEKRSVKAEAMKQYLGSTFNMPGINRPLKMVEDDFTNVIRSTHKEQAIKNDLLLFWGMVMQQIQYVQTKEDITTYIVTFLDQNYFINVLQKGNEVSLLSITDQI